MEVPYLAVCRVSQPACQNRYVRHPEHPPPHLRLVVAVAVEVSGSGLRTGLEGNKEQHN